MSVAAKQTSVGTPSSTRQIDVDLEASLLSRAAIDTDLMKIDRDSPVGIRLTEMLQLVSPTYSESSFSIQIDGKDVPFRATWPDGPRHSRQIHILAPDGEPTLQMIAENPISTRVGDFHDLSNVDLKWGRYLVNISIDKGFCSASAESALKADSSLDAQRYIVHRIPENEVEAIRLRSARFVGSSEVDGVKKLNFIGDSGNEFSIPEAEISEIFRAGKAQTVSTTSSTEHGVVQIVGFENFRAEDYIARFQRISIRYASNDSGGRELRTKEGQYLGIREVPILTPDGKNIARNEKFVFLLTGISPDATDLPSSAKLCAIQASEIKDLRAFPGNRSPVRGNQHVKGLGFLDSYEIGNPIFSRPS